QTELRRVVLVVLVVKCHWLKRQDHIAAFVHRLDIFFEPSRGAHCTKLACYGINHYRYRSIWRCYSVNALNKDAAVLVAVDAPFLAAVDLEDYRAVTSGVPSVARALHAGVQDHVPAMAKVCFSPANR